MDTNFVNLDVSEFAEQSRLTRAGAAAVLLGLDPMHDYEEKFTGYPDGHSARRYINHRNSHHTITAPSGAPTDPYDALITLNPYDGHTAAFGHVVFNGNDAQVDYDHSESTFNYRAFQIATKPSGTGSFYNVGWFTNLAAGTASYDYENTTLTGNIRICGIGIEVHNTTASLYRQGTVTVARWPVFYSANDIRYNDTNAAPRIDVEHRCHLLHRPPSNLNDLIRQPGAVQWEASKGIYAVAQKDNPLSHDFQALERSELLFVERSTTYAGYDTVGTIPRDITTAALSSVIMATGHQGLQIMFTGLSPETTLSVHFRVLYEMVPYYNDEEFQLTSAPPMADRKALKFLATMQQRMPTAVYANMNAKGDYLRMLKTMARTIIAGASTLALNSPNPYLKAAGLVGQTALAYGNAAPKTSQKKKKKVNLQRRINDRKVLMRTQRV